MYRQFILRYTYKTQLTYIFYEFVATDAPRKNKKTLSLRCLSQVHQIKNQHACWWGLSACMANPKGKLGTIISCCLPQIHHIRNQHVCWWGLSACMANPKRKLTTLSSYRLPMVHHIQNHIAWSWCVHAYMNDIPKHGSIIGLMLACVCSRCSPRGVMWNPKP